MYPWAGDRAGYASPQDGLLPILDVIPESETTIVPYGKGGDSGSITLDRKGRIVALLTGAVAA